MDTMSIYNHISSSKPPSPGIRVTKANLACCMAECPASGSAVSNNDAYSIPQQQAEQLLSLVLESICFRLERC